LSDHLVCEKGDPKGKKTGNSCNGHGSKRLTGEDGEMEIAVPRDRDANFEPKKIKKGQRRFDGFDDKIISMYGKGMSVREIRGSSGGTLRRRGVAGFDFTGYRGGDGRSPGVTKPTFG